MTLTTLAFDDVAVGATLPELPIPITTTLIVAGALASRDSPSSTTTRPPPRRGACRTSS
jgi:hypothetical protein